MNDFSIPKHLKYQYSILSCFLMVIGFSALWLINKPIVPYIAIPIISIGFIFIIISILSLLKIEFYVQLIKSLNSTIDNQNNVINLYSSKLADAYIIHDKMVSNAMVATFGKGLEGSGFKPTLSKESEPTGSLN